MYLEQERLLRQALRNKKEKSVSKNSSNNIFYSSIPNDPAAFLNVKPIEIQNSPASTSQQDPISTKTSSSIIQNNVISAKNQPQNETINKLVSLKVLFYLI